jgi:prepilin-type processing-associated H-X9-DG protein
MWPLPPIPSDDVYITFCVSTPTAQWKTQAGKYWMYNGMEYTDYNHNGIPNDPRPSCGGTDYGLHPPRSFHPQSVNVLFGDGRVESISNSISRMTWHNLGTRNGSDF